MLTLRGMLLHVCLHDRGISPFWSRTLDGWTAVRHLKPLQEDPSIIISCKKVLRSQVRWLRHNQAIPDEPPSINNSKG